MASISVSGEDLRYWRLKRVMSREDLAERAGVAKSTINNLECGWRTTANPRTIRKLAGALRVSPEKLVVEVPVPGRSD